MLWVRVAICVRVAMFDVVGACLRMAFYTIMNKVRCIAMLQHKQIHSHCHLEILV